MTLKQVLEALVFASPKPITTEELAAALRSAALLTENQEAKAFANAKTADLLAALAEVEAELVATARPYHLVERVNGWTLISDPTSALWVRQLYPEAKPTRLTGPQLETLAIIAYRQPVTRADCEAVRGVSVDGVMQVLLDRSLVKIAGRAEVPGRPLLYCTTEYFLQHFGLKTTDELPNAGELKRIPLPTAPPPAPKAEKPQKSKASPQSTEILIPPTEVATEIPVEIPTEVATEVATEVPPPHPQESHPIIAENPTPPQPTTEKE